MSINVSVHRLRAARLSGGKRCAAASASVCVDMRTDMCVDMRMDMCLDMRMDMCVDMRMDMCVDMRVDLEQACVQTCDFKLELCRFLHRAVYTHMWHTTSV